MSVYPLAKPISGAMDVIGIPVHAVTVEDVHRFIDQTISRKEMALVLNVNINAVNLAWKNAMMRELFQSAQMVFCDGDGVRWGLKILGEKVPVKITYDRWLWQLADFCGQKGFSLFFLGGKPGVAEAAAQAVKGRHPNVRIAGTHHGYFAKKGDENDRVVGIINRAKPDILILGFGMPIQEEWLNRNWKRAAAHIFLTGGAVFDYASGAAERAPDWMIRANLEWLFRWMKEPRRLFKRYFYGNPYFISRMIIEKIKRILK